jgi:uncharacterized protein (DUF885 family)
MRLLRAAIILCCLSCSHAPAVKGGNEADRRAAAVTDAVVHEYLSNYVTVTTALRIPGERFDNLPPSSLADVRAKEKREDALQQELATIDAGALSDPSMRLAVAVAREYLESSIRVRVCRYELWSVSPAINGWQVSMGLLAQMQPVGTDDLRAQALSRFRWLPRYIDDQIDALREGMRLGYTAAEPSVRAVLAQLEMLEAGPVEQSPYFSPADRDGTPAFKDLFAALMRDGIRPAMRRYREFLANEYLPHARKTVGVSSMPDGDACYRASLRRFTTLDLDPREVHALGQRQLDEIESEMKQIAQRNFGTTDLPAVMEKLRNDPQYVYRDRDDITAQVKAALARAKAAMPQAFHLMPKADFGLEPIPAYQEKSASPHYLTAALDGSRAAAYRIRYYEPQKQSRATGEAIAFHEVIPGHHLQVAIAHERAEIPPIARYIGNSGFSEGWGLYAERLADEMHLYSGDIDRMGMLSTAALRSVRMVVDPGMHVLGWDRQKAIDMMLAHTTFSPSQASAEIDRYISWPGQSPSYTIGSLQILELREKARKALGAHFDLHEFHDRVLENGSVPLPLLRQNVEQWIRSRSGS